MEYVVSYLAPSGSYAVTEWDLSPANTAVNKALTARQGVFEYGGGFPADTWHDSNYLVDVVFTPEAASPAPTPTRTVTPTPTSSPTSAPTSAQAPSSGSTTSNGKTNCAAKPSVCGYPDETNTGVPAGLTLQKSGSVIASRAGQVIDGLDSTGEIVVSAPNVVIKNTKVTGGKGAGASDWVIIIRDSADDVTIQDSEITTPSGSEQDNACVFNISNSAPRLLRVDIHGCSQGVSSGAGLIENSYIHDMSQVPGLSHVDSIASNGDGGLIVRHNTIFNQFDQTAAVALFQDFGVQRDKSHRK